MAKGIKLSNEERELYEIRSGLDVLRQFIPDKDYTDTLIEYAAAGSPQLNDHGERSEVRERMIDRTVAVLTYFRNNGYNFSVEPDIRKGQLKAKLTDSNISVRILDTDENEQYVGRVYNDGVSAYFSALKDGRLDRKIDATPEMTVDLVRYMLGESVNRIDKSDGSEEGVVMSETVGSVNPIRGQYDKPATYMPKGKNELTTLYIKGKKTERQGVNGRADSFNNNVYIKCKSERSRRSDIKFRGDTALSDADTFIRNSYESAEQNFKSELKLSAVDILAQNSVNGEFEGLPEFSDKELVAGVQAEYFKQRVAIYKNDNLSEQAKREALDIQDVNTEREVKGLFGNLSLKTVNPTNISAFMDNQKGMLANEENLLAALKAAQKNGEPYFLEGEGFVENRFREQLVAFDDNIVRDNDGKVIYPKNINPDDDDFDELSEFWQEIGRSVYAGLTDTGVAVDSIQVGANGVIHYEGKRHIGESIKSADNNKVIGDIGQVFEPETAEYNSDGSINLKHGLIETKFESGENYYIAPGYTAYVVPPTQDNPDQPFEERTRLRGYVQEMSQTIRATLRCNLIANDKYDDTAGLNGVYHHIYGNKLPLDFEDQMRQITDDNSMIKAINETALRRIRYDNCYKDGTSMLSKANADARSSDKAYGYNIYTDNVKQVMAIMNAETSAGIFDPVNTGTGTNQGIVRYLTSDAKVNLDGSIVRGDNTKCQLCEHPDFKYLSFNPPDRAIMSLMNAMNQSSTARGRDVNPDGEKIERIGVGTAHMALGGYTQDDAFVVSKSFAETNVIRGSDGQIRPLKIGDKICDHSGNKGVISFIADPDADMSYYEPTPIAEGMSERQCKLINAQNNTKELQKRVIEVFKANPTLDVIGAPYTAPSRYNGGTAREMIDSQSRAQAVGMPTTLNIEGRAIEGGIGYMNWIVTDMPVDEKTHLYEKEGGRNASGQMVWCLAEVEAKEVIDEIYRFNDAPTVKTRELLIAMGLDLSESGEILKGYHPHMVGIDENGVPQYEKRNEFSTIDALNANRDSTGKRHRNNYSAAFYETMSEDGGFMKLPFPLVMVTGEQTPEAVDENGKGTGEYSLPVLAGKYRSSRETVDQTLVVHEYTADYRSIYENAGVYLSAKEELEEATASGDVDKITKTKKAMNEAFESAQRSYDKMANSISSRYFEGKHNVFKDDVMRKQLLGTATAVISPDGSLDVDEISMTATTAAAIGIDVDYNREHDIESHTIIWRDPLLSAGGMRYPRVRIIENRSGYPGYDERNPLNGQIGIAMNPSSATSYEADFDGDSIGAFTPQTKAAQRSASEKLGYAAQLLNRECGDPGEHNMYFQDGLDVAAGIYYDECAGGDLRARFDAAKQLANQADMITDSAERKQLSEQALVDFNSAMHDAQNAAFGQDVICYASAEEHIKSLIPMIKSGAKGSKSKLIDGYGKYFGAKFDIDDNYNVVNFEDVGSSYATEDERQASFAATHGKAYLTGVAGKFSQHAEMAALNKIDNEHEISCSASATALTHPVTQSVMQLKHDTAESILKKIDMIQNVGPELWAGHKIQRTKNYKGESTWEVVTESNPENGQLETVQASPEEWHKMLVDFYTDKNGLNVAKPNIEHVKTMSAILNITDKQNHQYIQGFDPKTKALMPTEQPLTRLSYEGNFKTLCRYANMKEKTGKSACLFSGSVSQMIAPQTVRYNMKERQKAEVDPTYQPDYRPLAAKDTQVKTGTVKPSVDAVYKVMVEGAQNDIHVCQMEQQTTVKTSANEQVVSEKSYTDMSIEERTKVLESLARKSCSVTTSQKPVLTAAERVAYSMVMKQKSDYDNMCKTDKNAAIQAKQNGQFFENTTYLSMRKLVKDEQATTKTVSPEQQSEHNAADNFEAIARSVTKKWMQLGKMPIDLTADELAFRDRLVKQNSLLAGMTAAERNAYVSSHSEDFKERIACSSIRKELESNGVNAKSKATVVNMALPAKLDGFVGAYYEPSEQNDSEKADMNNPELA